MIEFCAYTCFHFIPLEEIYLCYCKEVDNNSKADGHRFGDWMWGLMEVQLWLKWADV